MGGREGGEGFRDERGKEGGDKWTTVWICEPLNKKRDNHTFSATA